MSIMEKYCISLRRKSRVMYHNVPAMFLLVYITMHNQVRQSFGLIQYKSSWLQNKPTKHKFPRKGVWGVCWLTLPFFVLLTDMFTHEFLPCESHGAMTNAERFYMITKAYNILKRVQKVLRSGRPLQFLSPFWQMQPYESTGSSLYSTALRTPVEASNRYFLTLFSALYFSAKLLSLFSQSMIWVGSLHWLYQHNKTW